MSCGCVKVEKTPLWSAIPPFRQPTDIQPGENIDCYAKRTGSVSGLQNDNGPKLENRIDNTSFLSDTQLQVNTTFKLTPASTKVPTVWKITVDGTDFSTIFPELTVTSLTSSTFTVSGTVDETKAGKSYSVLVEADDGSGQIDSRTFTFFPKKGSKDDTIQFVIPLSHPDGVRVTSPYGPRKAPAAGASTFHRGVDMSVIGNNRGTIVSAADGIVVKAGPMNGFGNAIMIEHSDAQGRLVATTVYGHMNTGHIYVSVGDKVAAGQKIALEGNAGIGNATHLHFEIHKGKWAFGAGVDPTPYLNGALPVAVDTGDPDPAGNATPTGYNMQANASAGMTTAESTADDKCTTVVPNTYPNQELPAKNPSDESVPAAPTNNVNKYRSPCAPADTPSTAEVIAKIEQACNEAGLTEEDIKFIKTVATIESGLDPYAKNPTSSAMGLYQFLDPIAVSYYNKIGETCNCVNRCDPYIATKAMIRFFQDEFLPYWNGYQSSGGTKIANKTIKDTAWSRQYPNLTRNEFLYGLIHHDGVGNAVNGKDLQGVTYWRSRVGTA